MRKEGNYGEEKKGRYETERKARDRKEKGTDWWDNIPKEGKQW